MQKSIIVQGKNPYTVTELNSLLQAGWKVIHTCPMPSACSISITSSTFDLREREFLPQCLVILER